MRIHLPFSAGLLVAVSSLCLLSGCAVALLGLGAAAGTFAYVEGKLTRTYENGYHESIQASTTALARLSIPVASQSGDEAKTTVVAKRADGKTVEVEVVNLKRSQTEIGVRTGLVGVWDREASLQIHRAIAAQLTRRPTEEASPLPVSAPAPQDSQLAESVSASRPEPRPVKKPKAVKLNERPVRRESPPAAPPAYDPKKHADATLYFEKGSFEVPAMYQIQLDGIAETMRSDPASAITLHGYSDGVGSSAVNLMLSAKRAHAVKVYLVEKGVNPEQIITIAHGATGFVADNQSAEGRKQNRRVAIEAHSFKLD
jgi:outer membrane protein OmpA-like peptidoglycan-associated protein